MCIFRSSEILFHQRQCNSCWLSQCLLRAEVVTNRCLLPMAVCFPIQWRQWLTLDFRDDRLVCDSPTLLSLQRLEETGPERGETSGYPWPCPQAPQTGALPQPTPHRDPGQMLSENHNCWPERWSLGHVGIVSWWHLVVKQDINYPKIPPVAAFRLRTTWCHLSFSTWVNSHFVPSLLRGTSSRPVDRGTYGVQWTTRNHKSKQTLSRSWLATKQH